MLGHFYHSTHHQQPNLTLKIQMFLTGSVTELSVETQPSKRSLTFQIHIKLLEIGSQIFNILCMEERERLFLQVVNLEAPDEDKSHLSSDFVIRLFPQLHIWLILYAGI